MHIDANTISDCSTRNHANVGRQTRNPETQKKYAPTQLERRVEQLTPQALGNTTPQALGDTVDPLSAVA